MVSGFYNTPEPKNEPVLSYEPGSKERAGVKTMLKELRNTEADIPMMIDGEPVYTGKRVEIRPPHDLSHLLGYYHKGDETHVEKAIRAALRAKATWAGLGWQHRTAVFLKAADLLAGPYRARINAATMLGQSKNIFQAEIDAACELADFFRFGVKAVTDMYKLQPESAEGTWNYNDYRPLEGFVLALTPFNFTSIAGNLPAAPAMLGNTVVWKPSKNAVYSAHVIMEVLQKAGLPEGVINLVLVNGPDAARVVFDHPDFAGVHFTGSTDVFRSIWKNIGQNIQKFRSYPRIVGETGGKDFIFVHSSADPEAVATAMTRGAFEYQGQKCSAASRAYIPMSLWPILKERILSDVNSLTIGPPENFTHFLNAVIDEDAFDKLAAYIEGARESGEAEILFGGTYNKNEGYFINPTIILARKPDYITMREELFGPVLTVYVYEGECFDETLDILDRTSAYALTGSVFSEDRYAIERITTRLEYAAGNFYINDKPTGAVVGQQPFGGSRGSGTNDKAGTIFNMLRWVSIRTIKENFLPPKNPRYPYMEDV